MADLDTTNNLSNNQPTSGSNPQDLDNLSPWEVDLDVPEQKAIANNQPIEGTLYDQSANQQAVPEPVALNIPDKPISQVGQTLPASDFIPNSVPVEASSPQYPVSEISQNAGPALNDIVSPKPPIVVTDQAAVAQTVMPQPSQLESLPDNATSNGNQPHTMPQVMASPISDFWHNLMNYRQIIAVLASLVILIGGMIFLTETGNLSFGLEKVYGAIGMEKLWGGLPKDTSQAFVVSFSKLSSEQTFKLNGTITATIDASKPSPIFSPLIAQVGSPHLAQDVDLTRPQFKAVKAAATSDYDTILNGTADQSLDFLSNNSNSTAVNSNSGNSTVDSNSNDNTNAGSFNSFYDDQGNYPSYQTDSSVSRDIYADLTGAFSPSGTEAILKIKKAVGTADIDLKNSGGKLWVKSDKDIKFATNANPDKYLEYDISSLSGNSIQSVLFSPLMLNSLTVSGKREANEPMGGVRCYRYSIDNLVLGNNLSSFGLSQDNIKNISGILWVGIKDKLPRRISLKITGSNVAVTKEFDIALDFYDYAVQNNFTSPTADETISPIASSNTNSSQNTAPVVTNDQTRKTDIQNIEAALESYKTANGSYPLSSSLLKLNISGNIVQSALSPAYLAIWPADPKASDGWYYSYKSNGATYSLSARLEDAADPSVTLTNGIPLYIVSSATVVATGVSAATTADSTRKSDLAKIKAALLQYYDINREYPIANTLLKIGLETTLKSALVPTYLTALPVDPKTGWYYGYKSPDGQSFTLSAQLENTSDSQAKKVGSVYLYFLYNE